MKCQNCGHETGQRTSTQSNALHLFCKLLADSLNEAGLDVRKVVKPTFNIPWTKESVKEYIWRPFQKALFQTTSTRDLSKLEQIDLIHKTIMRELGEKHGLEFIPFTKEKAPLVDEVPVWHQK